MRNALFEVWVTGAARRAISRRDGRTGLVVWAGLVPPQPAGLTLVYRGMAHGKREE